MSNEINILHLSDIHFGVEPTDKVIQTAIAQRKNTLNSLLKTLEAVEPEWKPHIVVISGDIAWKGIKQDYEIAKKWIERLLSNLNLTKKELIVCAGNHDIDRTKTVGMDPPTSAEKADSWLKIEKLENFIRPFQSFNRFCEDLNIPELMVGRNRYYLIGQRKVKDLRFVVLNSSWFCRGASDKSNLWLGLPQLEVMNASSQLLKPDRYDSDNITIGVIHHPDSWLNEKETNAYNNRKNTYSYLADRCHIILSGHVHGAIERPAREYIRAYVFTGGTSYAGSDYRNNFSILKVDKSKRSVIRRSFEFDPRNENWNDRIDDSSYSLKIKDINDVSTSKTETTKEIQYNYSLLAEKARNHALHYVEQKSRAITRTPVLPAIIERKVAVHPREERIGRTQEEELRLRTIDNVAPISEMVSVERPTFLFGELGSGKSTLVGDYVIKLSNQIEGLIPLLIPAKFFLNKEIDTVAKFSNELSNYVNDQIEPSQNTFDLRNSLADKIEITLVIDGFDELDKVKAQETLSKAEELLNHWSGLRVVATGRPIELRELNYNRWQCLEMLPLTELEQEKLLINEGIVDGLDENQAKNDATRRLEFLRSRPELLSVAITPLTVRLMRPFLQETARRKSLGDLLYDILQERLGGWSLKEGKEASFKEFSKVYPDSASREQIMQRIAASMYKSSQKSIAKEALYTIVEDEIDDSTPNRNLAILQARDFFLKNVLQEDGDLYVFPSNPLFQFALGFDIVENIRGKQNQNNDYDVRKLWREYSFAATICRRKNLFPKVRNKFQACISDLINKNEVNASSAMIISEAVDRKLAEFFIESLEKCDFRPIRLFWDFRTQSSTAFAHCFYLSGEKGFNWFYEEYLNPIYPVKGPDSNIASSILDFWILLSEYKVTATQKEKLSTLPKPHLSAQSEQCYSILPAIAIVLPGLFSPLHRCLYYADRLESNMFNEKTTRLLKSEFENGYQEEVLKALETVSDKGESGNPSAIKLWFEFSENKPPLAIIHGVIKASLKKENLSLIKELESRIGQSNFSQSLKWYTLQSSKLATTIAILLYDKGERNFNLLGTALLHGLHDGGRVDRAEEILHSLIKDHGEKGLDWLVSNFHTADISDGAHSAYWRIFLSELNSAKKSYLNLFHYTIGYLGKWILPRYPEIRRGFQRLFTQKPKYKDVVERALKSIDKVVRFNAACILLTYNPELEIFAAEVVIKSVADYLFDYHEWYRFCLRLSLGKKVLNDMASKIDSFAPIAQTFALALLYHNDYSLNKDQYRLLIKGLLSDSAGFLDRNATIMEEGLKTILAEQMAFEILLEYLGNKNLAAKNAAEALWGNHRSKLNPRQTATCLTIAFQETNEWNLIRLDAELDKVKKDTKIVQRIGSISQKIQKETSKEPLASILIRTSKDSSAWKDLLWSAMSARFGEIGHSFMWLFNKARKDPSVGKIIGLSAKEFLDHPAVGSLTHANDLIPWLTFLADEFSELEKDKIEKAILFKRPIGTEIISSLIARFGEVPSKYKPPREKTYYTVFASYNRIAIEKPRFKEVVEASRDAEEIPNDFVILIENALLSRALSKEELEQLALKSRSGALFATVLSFCRDDLSNYEWLARSIGLFLFNRPMNNSTKTVSNALRIIRKVIAEDSKIQKKYFRSIEHEIEIQDRWNVAILFRELLRFNQSLKNKHLSMLLSDISSHPSSVSLELANLLANYFVSNVKESQKTFVLSELKKAISTLNYGMDSIPSGVFGLVELLLSVAVFYLQDDLDEESERVFLIGLQSAFIKEYEPFADQRERMKFFKAREIVKSIYPLFKKVSPSIIRQAIQKGAKYDIPEISVLCKILEALISNKN